MAISRKQRAVFVYISNYVKEHGMPPTLAEIAGNFDFLEYPSSARYHVIKLQNEGYLERGTNAPRAIELNPDKSIKSPFMKDLGLDSVQLPIVGSANCGPAELLAEENIEGYVKAPKEMKRSQWVFVVRADGKSMNKARIGKEKHNIEPGDYVVIDAEDRDPESGDYVLSIIDGSANLKKFVRDDRHGGIKLVSESTETKYKPIYISSEDNFMVNGKVIGVIKK